VPLATDPKVATRGADQARAKAVDLTLSDFPSGWDSTEASDAADEPCADFHPNESDLTLTGKSVSPVFFTGSALAPETQRAALSLTRVFATQTQAQAAFKREAVRDFVRCLADDARESEVDVVAAGTIPFPKLVRGTRAFRLVVELEDLGREYVDYVFVSGRRSLVLLTFVGVSQPFDPALERSLAARVAKRANS
jgi:hypothetical protein